MEEPEREARPVDDDVARVDARQVLRGDLRLRLLDDWANRLVAARRLGGGIDRLRSRPLLDGETRLARPLLQLRSAVRGDHRGFGRVLVNACGELVDEALDRTLVIGHARREVRVHVAAARIPRDPVEDVPLAAAVDRLLDHAVDVGGLVELLRRQRVVLSLVADDDRLLQRRNHLALDDLASRVGIPSADVDPADLDPGRDLILLCIVVGPDPDREQQTQDDERHQGDQDLVGHVETCAHLRAVDQRSPADRILRSASLGSLPKLVTQRTLRVDSPRLGARSRMPSP